MNLPPQINAGKRMGRCYELAGRGIIQCANNSGWELVHGTARVFRGARLVGGHAWAENKKTGEAYDAVTNRFYLLPNYRRNWNAKPRRRYTPRQAAMIAAKVGHWGPWR